MQAFPLDEARPAHATSPSNDNRMPNTASKTGTRSRQSSRSPGPTSPTHNLAPQSKTAAQLRRMNILPALPIYDSLSPPARQTLSLDPTIVIPHPCATYSLAATPCLSYLLTGNQDGYVRSWDFWASANSGSALTAVQRSVANLGEGVNKAGVAKGYWKNEAEVEEVVGGDTGGGKIKDKKVHQSAGNTDSAFSFLESGQAGATAPERKRVKRLEPVHSLAVQSDGLWTLCGTESGPINLTTLRHVPGTIVHALQGPQGHTKTVSALCLSSDETKAFSGSWDQTIKQWDLNTGQVIRTFTKHRGQISSLQMQPENVGAGIGNSLAPSLMVGNFTEGDGKSSTGNRAEQSEDESKPHRSATEDVEMKELQQAEDGLENAEQGSDYDSLFGDEDGEKEGEETDDRPVKANNANTTSSTDVQAPAGTEGFDFPFDGPPAATATSKPPTAQLPPPPKSNSVTGQKGNFLGGKHQGLPALTPAMYRQFSDDVMLASGIDGEVALHDRRIGGDTLVGRLESSEKTPPWYGQQVIAGRRNASLDVWDIRRMGKTGTKETPSLLRTLKHPATSGASVDCVRLWNTSDLWLPDSNMKKTKSGVPFRIVAGHHGGTVSSIYIDPTGKYMITASGSRGWVGDTTRVVLVHERK
ncbi:hypothetical protein QFC21_003362 [Naganishia friedmannii]|uniref:Uncharacterized protein n=1 Tax=Naganishia friedmannii TaxID=89922 RepID=A0ACC2VQ49_9TREE|nr:hypothetical protein QFC21_003362 [Naganishia friedmannii]